MFYTLLVQTERQTMFQESLPNLIDALDPVAHVSFSSLVILIKGKY